MKAKYVSLIMLAFFCASFTGNVSSDNWKEEFSNILPLLGHRNWIVVTDMAYPLQNQPGIQMIYTNDSYMNVLSFAYEEIDKAPHIKPIIYQDLELSFLNDSVVKEIDTLKIEMTKLFGTDKVIELPHEELITLLDEKSRMFNIIILKTNQTLPYISTFMELDCSYWNEKSFVP